MRVLGRVLLRLWQMAVISGGLALAVAGWQLDGAVGLALFSLIGSILVLLLFRPRLAVETLIGLLTILG